MNSFCWHCAKILVGFHWTRNTTLLDGWHFPLEGCTLCFFTLHKFGLWIEKRIIISSECLILFLLLIPYTWPQLSKNSILAVVVDDFAPPQRGKYLFWLLCFHLNTCTVFCNLKLESFVISSSNISLHFPSSQIKILVQREWTGQVCVVHLCMISDKS
jgi:hypothetical protein